MSAQEAPTITTTATRRQSAPIDIQQRKLPKQIKPIPTGRPGKICLLTAALMEEERRLASWAHSSSIEEYYQQQRRWSTGERYVAVERVRDENQVKADRGKENRTDDVDGNEQDTMDED